MSITQETANLVETLASAASQIGSTAASAKINQLIVDILPATTGESAESIAEALRLDNIALQQELTGLQISSRSMAENLALLRQRMVCITETVNQALPGIAGESIAEDLQHILELAAPIDATAEA